MEEEIVSYRKASYVFLLLFTTNIFLLTANFTGYVRTIKNFVYYVLFPSNVAAVSIVDSVDNISANIKDIVRVHQENLRAVRQEGSSLLAAWNNLIERSIPDDVLRADSPSLPVNQAGGHPGPSPAGLDTSETIRVSSSDSP